jgi:hypothetical protein
VTPFVLAHFGHWYVSMLYLGPVLAVVLLLAVQTRRERGRDEDEDDEEHEGRAGPDL